MTRQSCRGPAHGSEIGKRSISMRYNGWTHVGTVPLLRRLIALIVAATLVAPVQSASGLPPNFAAPCWHFRTC